MNHPSTASITGPPGPPTEAIASQQGRVMARLFITFLGGALILNSFLIQLCWPREQELYSFCAFLGSLLLGAPLIIHAAQSVFAQQLKMTELAALAILASFALGQYQTAGLVAFFMLLAELLQSRTALGARAAIEGLVRLAPDKAHRLREDGAEEEILVSGLRTGDRLRVRPGENIPADGIVLTGQSVVREAEITGESTPVEKSQESEVYAGTHNLTGLLEMRVTRAGSDTTLGRVRQLILKAEETKTPIMRIIDRHVGWYTPTVLMIAGMILFFTRDMDRTITALVVTCPSALILATPTALVAALSCAARLGILIKDVGDLEQAGEINAIFLDKTGTLTTGELAVSRLKPAPGVEAATLLELAACLARFSNHPMSKAVVAVAQQARIPLNQPTSLQEVPGKGVHGLLGQEQIRIGRESWLREEGIDFSSLTPEEIAQANEYSPLFVSRGCQLLGWLGLEDKTREEAREATRQLQELGIGQLTMLTGDRWAVARRVAAALGCSEVQAECLPETKLELVQRCKKAGYRVAVVGDGVNDAPALASGDLGIAMGAAGNDIAIHSANIALLNNNLSRLPFLIRLARRTRRIVNQNLIFGSLFILGGLTLSGFGLLTPIIGAILHNIGAFVIIFNSARLVRFGEELTV